MTLWTVACQVPLSMGFFRHEYWSRLPGSPPRDLPDPGIECASLASPSLAGGFFMTSVPCEATSRPRTRQTSQRKLRTLTGAKSRDRRLREKHPPRESAGSELSAVL